MLRIDLKPGESVRVGSGQDSALITLEEKSGQRARIAFEADRRVPIERVNSGSNEARMFASMGIAGEKSTA